MKNMGIFTIHFTDPGTALGQMCMSDVKLHAHNLKKVAHPEAKN